jgi:hypothetical protein
MVGVTDEARPSAAAAVDTDVDAGTTFIIELPLHPGAPPQEES